MPPKPISGAKRATGPVQSVASRPCLISCSFSVSFTAADSDPVRAWVTSRQNTTLYGPSFLASSGPAPGKMTTPGLHRTGTLAARPTVVTSTPAHLLTSTGMTVSILSAPLARITGMGFEAIFLLYFFKDCTSTVCPETRRLGPFARGGPNHRWTEGGTQVSAPADPPDSVLSFAPA